MCLELRQCKNGLTSVNNMIVLKIVGLSPHLNGSCSTGFLRNHARLFIEFEIGA